jgi:CoA:oxalate CoA-transferase
VNAHDDRPLAGIKVLDLSRFVAGPHAAQMMGDMGADVVKIEGLGGEPSRRLAPLINGESTYFMALNRSKRGMALDLRSPAGLEVLRGLMKQADILIENFRPGTLAEMGFPPEELARINEGLIVVSISGHGQDGPYASRGCFDSVAQAMSGLTSVTGQPDGPPVRAGFYVGDYGASLYATIGALLALNSRSRTGKGQHVDVSLVEALLSMTTTFIPGFLGAGVAPGRDGNGNPHAAPADLFEASDGYVQIAASTDGLFRSLTQAMGRPELVSDARFATHSMRVANTEALNEEVSAWTRQFTKRELSQTLSDHEVPAGPILTIPEVVQDEQLRHRGFFTSIDHPVAGGVQFAGPVVRLSHTPARATQPAPLLGQHTEEVLHQWLGADATAIGEMRMRGAFGPAATKVEAGA